MKGGALTAIVLACWLPAAALAAPAAPTFSKDVAPILHKNCAGCHRPGEIAPMSLLTYEDARPWAASIKEKVTTGAMSLAFYADGRDVLQRPALERAGERNAGPLGCQRRAKG